jgi:hypothetical protein
MDWAKIASVEAILLREAFKASARSAPSHQNGDPSPRIGEFTQIVDTLKFVSKKVFFL